MTQDEKNRLNDLTNLELVEELLKLQQDADRFHELRAKSDYASEEWGKYHELLYKKNTDVLEVKYMVIHRMGGCVGK